MQKEEGRLTVVSGAWSEKREMPEAKGKEDGVGNGDNEGGGSGDGEGTVAKATVGGREGGNESGVGR